MHEELWKGIELKIEHAKFFLEKMQAALAPPERTGVNVAIQASGGIIGTTWQRSFYPYLDAFLVMARSVPEIIHACFGADSGVPIMEDWFAKLSDDERRRRKCFTNKYKSKHGEFGRLPLSKVRNIVQHRTGVAPVERKIEGPFEISYIGTPLKRVPDAESRSITAGDDPSLQWEATLPSMPLESSWQDFTIDGRPLFPECRAYLERVCQLVAEARTIAASVHGSHGITPPPA